MPAAAGQLSVFTFYHFAPIADCVAVQQSLQEACAVQDLRGTVLVAPEGMNGTLSGSEPGLRAVMQHVCDLDGFSDLGWKQSLADEHPFHRLKIRLKKEIITMGVPEVDSAGATGVHVPASEWNALISDPDVLLVDTRNDYETEIGRFRGAVDYHMHSFREFPGLVNGPIREQAPRKVAMYCTGGVRCEKASAYMRSQGFDEVYQLQGGILKYLEEVPADESLWEGECFVFDQRVSLGHGLEQGELDQCPGCRHALTDADKERPGYVQGVSCYRCADTLTEEQRSAFAERARQERLARERGARHVGAQMPRCANGG